jgi:acetoin utilization deacetylase AcuC-like enzyme
VCCRRGRSRIAIVDPDVHHGNGTAFTFESDPRVFTFSMHQQHNYPIWKPRGSLDVGPSTARTTRRFARTGARAAGRDGAPAACVFYLAGVDPHEDDQLGGLR